MKKITYTTKINATPEKVWKTLWEPNYYEQWTSIFHIGSYMISNWIQGGTVHFLTPSGNGMYSSISHLNNNHSVTFTHIGNIENYKEAPINESSKSWSGSEESYNLSFENDYTLLTVHIDAITENESFINTNFPKALAIIKDIAERNTLAISTLINNCPIEKVWEYWNQPQHITQWCRASEDWHAPKATNNLEIGGKFCTTMAAKDGTLSFNFDGIYNEIIPYKKIVYTISDGRKVYVLFILWENEIKILQLFEIETTNSKEMQKNGWQAILNNFAGYCEKN
jgi:uncharacterized protein YndB with AHSA1/START domain